MKKMKLLITLALLAIFAFSLNLVISNEKKNEHEKRGLVDTRIDNLNYWVKAAEKGLVPFNPEVKVKKSIYTGSAIKAFSSLTEDSPDVPVAEFNSTQSENSIFVDPNDFNTVLNSNNSTDNPLGSLYGANDLYSFDLGETWEGEVEGAGGDNSGDPTAAIGMNGRWFVNYISSSGGQGCSYSDDQGENWTAKTVAPNPGQLADKNHMWIDNSPDSPFEGYLYVAWTNFGGADNSDIALAYSHDDGESWMVNNNISDDGNDEDFCQGVNLSTGPNGEVYAIWIIYDSWPRDENAIAMAKSYDGGVTWEPAVRIIENIRGIRNSGTSKNMRVNSFPCAAVDNSYSPDRGAIYVCWTNIGTPGENTGDDMDVYLIKSSDEGDTWSTPIRVNKDEPGLGKQHYFPWITCDPANGILSAIFYDDRNVSSTDIEVYCANSEDGGITWEDFKVSDASSTPSPIPGLADSYFGDYLGITAQDGWVYPVWTDNRSGTAMSYVSPYKTNPLNRPLNLEASVTFETGAVDLIWSYEEGENFIHFKLYRDGEFLTTVDDTIYTDMLPDYGLFKYQVTAAYTENMESGSSATSIQWGDAHISLSTLSISDHLIIGEESDHYLTVTNTGQLDLNFSIKAQVNGGRAPDEYCDASGGGDEHISRVQLGDIDNVSGDSSYFDYTSLVTTMRTGETYPITVSNGNPYEQDQCGIWIDWDGNGEFDEEMIQMEGSPGNGPYTANISPPTNAVTGLTRMRIRIMYTGELLPCGETQYGEVEDYSINIQSWLGINPVSGTISPGASETIAVNFNATNIDIGIYAAIAQFTSNDPDVPEIEVDISLQVSQAIVSIVAEQEAVCAGETLNLNATVLGSEGVDYFWYSEPEGLSGETSEIEVTPEVPTWYFVSVTDTSFQTLTDSIFIEAFPLPVVEIGADTSICGDMSWALDAGNSGLTYLWSTGETTQTIEISSNQVYGDKTYSVEVTTPETCVNSDEITINWVNCSGIEEIENNAYFDIFPNPASSLIQLKLVTSIQKTTEVEIYDLHGKKVYTTKIPAGQELIQLNVSHLESGIYYVQLKMENKTVTKKLIIN